MGGHRVAWSIQRVTYIWEEEDENRLGGSYKTAKMRDEGRERVLMKWFNLSNAWGREKCMQHENFDPTTSTRQLQRRQLLQIALTLLCQPGKQGIWGVGYGKHCGWVGVRYQK